MLIRIGSRLFSAKPHRFCPHCSICTLPLLSWVAHRPSGVAAASAVAAGCSAGGAEAGAVAAAGAGVVEAVTVAGGRTGLDVDGVTSWSRGAFAVDASVTGAGDDVVATGAGACACGAAAGAVFCAGGLDV